MNTLNQILLQNVLHEPVKRLVIGINWTIVEGEQGCGLAHTPRRSAPGCQPIAEAGELSARDLKSTAALVNSKNPIAVSIGMAAINAWYNRYDLVTDDDNGLDVFRGTTDTVTAVGRFPGLDRRYPFLNIIEKEPQKEEYPESKAEEILKLSRHTIITASTFVNGTALQMLSYAKNSEIAFIGPGTPLCTRLFELGVNVLSGIIITNPDEAFRIVAEGGAVKELKKVGRFATLRKN